MALAPGTQLGPYEITAAIGAGGMGEANESGRQEIYVQSFPAGSAKWLVSSGGGILARWRSDGKELFYRELDGKLMVASVRSAPGGLEFGTPNTLFRTSEPQGQFSYPTTCRPTGKGFLYSSLARLQETPPPCLLSSTGTPSPNPEDWAYDYSVQRSRAE